MFTDRLRIGLSLAAGGETFALTSGSIEHLALSIRPHGFEADVSFLVSSDTVTDTLIGPFSADDPITATLSVATCVLEGTEVTIVPVVVSGLVLERSLREVASDEIEGNPIVVRHYRVSFVDTAAALWRQHHPVELFVDTSMKAVIDLYKVGGMTVSYDWLRLGETLDVLCVAAGEGEASFYDLLCWYLDRHGGLLEWSQAGGYRIAGAKVRPSAPLALAPEGATRVRLVGVEPPRHSTLVRNSFSEGPLTAPAPNTLAHTGVTREVLVRTPIVAQAARRLQREVERLKTPEHEIEIDFGRCPPVLHAPGAFITFGEGWSDKAHQAGKVYRVIGLSLRIVPADTGEVVEPEDEVRAFQIDLVQRLELATSPRPHLPDFTPPTYPIVVEGKVVSEGGGDDDRTWAVAESEKDSTLRYRVQVPLWNKKIIAPFAPGKAPGHFFFPAYKHERVLVALDFDGAEIMGFLDWAANARTPQGVQGNRIAFGYQATNGTTLDHAYPESSPTLTLARTFGNDLQTIIVKEGTIYLEVREDETVAELTPRYSVVLVVTASQEKVSGEVEAAMGEVTGSFEETMGSTSAKLDGSVAAVDAAASAAQARLVGKIEAVDGALAELSGALVALTAELSAAAAAAQAELAAALA